jgi:hypothetical protein
MPLIKPVLQSELNQAFSDAMTTFIDVVKEGGTDDVSQSAIAQAAQVFSDAAAAAIDSYIKSATIIVQPGQVVTGASPAGPITGATTTPSAPATIS